MPLNPIIARRYAGSLYQLTNDKAATSHFGKSKQILSELQTFVEATKSFKDGMNFFLNPVITRDEKKSAIQDLENKLPLIFQFVVTLIDADRMEYLEEISLEFMRLCEASAGELTVDVEFARQPSPAILEEIRSTLQTEWKKEIKIQPSINPALIGGFVAKAPGRVMDVSVASQLEALQLQLSA